MMKRFLMPFLLTMMLLACGGGGGSSDFQQNEAPGFQLAEITEGYGAIDDAWNSIDTKEFNRRLKRAVDEKRTEDEDPHENFEISSYGLADVLEHDDEPAAELVRADLQGIIARLVDTENRHLPKSNVDAIYTGSAPAYNAQFYAFLDRVSGAGFEAPPDYITGAMKKVLDYVLDDNLPENESGNPDKAWLNEKVQELVDDLVEDDPVERDFKDDFIDLSKLITKATLQTDYPLWLDEGGNPLNYEEINPNQHTNLGLGNAVKGSHDLVEWLNGLIMNPDTRALLRKAMLNFASILNPDPDAELVEKLKALVENLEEYFTIGGEAYENNPIYSQDDDQAFSDSEMGQLIRDASPFLQQLFTRSDRPQSMVVTKDGEAPVYPLDLMTANLRSIGLDPDTIDVERSIDDLMRHDLWGRNRLSDASAFPNSHLESLLFLTHLTANHGWRDGGVNGEFTNPSSRRDSRSDHGHGSYTEELTLNDALFSMHMIRLYGFLGAYELAFWPQNGDHLYRTRMPFALSDVDQLHNLDTMDVDTLSYTYQTPSAAVTGDDKDYRFFYDQNYGVLQFLAGPGPGDLGTPTGGNLNGDSLTTNQYRAYAPNGLNETQMAGWTMAWGVRACFNGEGPYYYADPSSETVSVGGQAYRRYLRPNGKTYALVSLDGTQYLYPAEDGDVEDMESGPLAYNGKRQRDNRYKSRWYSDYYMAHAASYPDNQNRYFTIDNSSGVSQLVPADATAEDPNPQARRLVYNELVAEADPLRACATPEEAFFRNYQWVMNEKKMVLVIPFYMWADESLKAIVFQVLECHGWSGLANARKLSNAHNHVWAKAGGTGASNIPGDYRIEITTAAADQGSADQINDVSVLSDTIDCGNATPSVVGHNLPALFRLAFPRSIEPQNSFEDGVLGSREFQVGDANWHNRNAFVPILFSLLSGLREHTPEFDPNNRPGINSGMRTFLNQTATWARPLFYYNKAGAPVPQQSWIPRVYGTNAPADRHKGFPFLKSSADFYAGTPDTWYGGETEQRFYQPAVMKTFLNVMIDSDITDLQNASQKRMDGLLPLVTETRALSNLLKVLLYPSVQAPPLEQILTATKFTKGEMTRINGSAESGKGMVYPGWMFATGVEETRDAYGAFTEYTGVRNDDIFLDDLLDRIVGRDALDADTDGYGLANYPDKQARLAADSEATEAPWEEFADNVDTMADLLHESSPYCISTNLLDAIERVFARQAAYTSEEIYGMLYAAGKVFGRYDNPSGRWIYQGEEQNFQDLYNMLATRVPVMNSAVIETESQNPAALGGPPGHYGLGDHYYSQLVLMSKMNEQDGLMEYIFNTMTAPQVWEVIMHDLNRFMNGYDISNDNSELWSTLADLLHDMGSAVGKSNQSDVIDTIIEDYGFQVNR